MKTLVGTFFECEVCFLVLKVWVALMGVFWWKWNCGDAK